MKVIKIITTAAILTLPIFSAHADRPATQAEKDALCNGMARLSETIMTHRQNGADLSVILGAITATVGENSTDPMAVLARELVIEAYDRPQFQTADAKSRSISRFKNETHVTCLQMMR